MGIKPASSNAHCVTKRKRLSNITTKGSKRTKETKKYEKSSNKGYSIIQSRTERVKARPAWFVSVRSSMQNSVKRRRKENRRRMP